jgi:hypothetical protein
MRTLYGLVCMFMAIDGHGKRPGKDDTIDFPLLAPWRSCWDEMPVGSHCAHNFAFACKPLVFLRARQSLVDARRR